MLDKIGQSALDSGDAKKLGFQPMSATEAMAKLKNMPAYFAGFLIPYFDLSGAKTKFWRYRYLESTKTGFDALTNKKPLRYGQASKTLNEVYLPPIGGMNWRQVAKTTEVPLVITEGELKAACATKMGIPTLGLGGVWCFKSNAARAPLLPMLQQFDWKDRMVYIAYDSDAVTNPQVMTAENALARELLNHGAAPHIIRIPPAKDGGKMGLDDFLVAHGPEEFQGLIEDAAEWRSSQELFELNQEVLYVRDPGIILVVNEGQRISPRAFVDHAFSTRVYYEEVATDKGTKMVEKSAPKEWLRWPHRAEVRKLVYEPGAPQITERNEYNLWRGWGCEPERNDTIKLWHQIMEYVFRKDKDARRWFEQWLAYPIQHPGTKLFSSAVIWSRAHGTGKSFIGYIVGAIYGSNFTEVDDDQIHAPHNEWAENKQFILGDEITGGDKRAVGERLKRMITRKKMRLNPKYIPSYEVVDCLNYYFTSNQPDSFFLEDEDRRMFIWEIIGRPLPEDFWIEVDTAYKDGSLPRALFDYLLNYDLTGFNPNAPALVTDAKRAMIDNGRSDLGAWVHTLKEDPDTVLRMDNQVLKFDLYRSEDLLAIYDPLGRGRVTANGMARELARAGFVRPLGTHGVRTSQGQVRLWAVRNVEKYMGASGAFLGEQYDKERGVKPVAGPTKKAKF